MTDRNDMATSEWHPAEGVRLIGAEEAQTAVDAGKAAGRRREPGPRTPPPASTRTRFSEDGSLPTIGPDGRGPASAGDDDAEIDLTDGYQRQQYKTREARSPRAMALTASPPAPPPIRTAGAPPPARSLASWGPPRPGGQEDEAPAGTETRTGAAALRHGDAEEHTDTDAFAYPKPAPSEDEAQSQDEAPSEARLTVTGGHALPHWTEPGDDAGPEPGSLPGGRETRPHVGSWARWRSEDRDWDDLDVGADLFPGDDEPRLGALDTDRSERSDLYSFDEAFRQLQEERSGSHPAISHDDPEEVPLIDDPGAGGTSARPGRPTSRRPLRPTGATIRSAGSPPSGRLSARLRRGRDRLRRPADRTAATVGGRRQGGEDRGPNGRDADIRSTSRAPGPSVAGASRATRARRRRRGQVPARSERSVLLSRVLVGAALVVLLIVAVAIGPKALVVLAAAVVLLCAAEAYSMLQRCGFRPATLLGLTATGGLMFASYWRGEPALPLIAVLAFAATMVWYLLGITDARPLANVAVTTMTILWVGVLGAFAALLLRAPNGKGLFLGAVVVTVAADIVAYFGGRRWGRHSLAPKVSPGKTVEGLVAGSVAAIVAGLVFGQWVTPWGGLYHGLLLGVAVAILAPIGDLFESLIKRDLEVKDSGTVLAGHGGLLDRFDSLLLVLPATYFLADYLHLVR